MERDFSRGLSIVERRKKVNLRGSETPKLSVSRQCRLLSISRSGLYYEKKGESAFNLAMMRRIDKQDLNTPWYGSHQMARGFVYLVVIMDWHTRQRRGEHSPCSESE